MTFDQVIRVPTTDLHLLERSRASDEAAFREIVARHKARVYNYVFRMTGSSEDAEDLTQEVFVRLYTSLGSFRGQSSLSTWLLRVAGNLCIDRFRRGRTRPATHSLDGPRGGGTDSEESGSARDLPDRTWEPHRLLENTEMAAQIQSALARLPEKPRAALILHDLEGLPYDEIAQIVGCPLGTVKSRLFNARMQMRTLLAPYLSA